MGYCDKLKKGKNMTEKKSYKENFTPEEREQYWERLYKDAEKENKKLRHKLYLASFERDEWKKRTSEMVEKYVDVKYG
tara:strand:- start:44 stop:277 length:234 start_codon:yes stop_codon:yes gene_type:complete